LASSIISTSIEIWGTTGVSLQAALSLVAAISVCLRGEAVPRAHFNEVYIHALISPTKFAKAVASKVFKIYPPAFFSRKIDGKVMLCAGRALADCCYVLPYISGQIFDMMRVERIIVDHGATFRTGRDFTRKQDGGGQQEDADYHLTLLKQETSLPNNITPLGNDLPFCVADGR
jgi:hypothetical protein